MKRSQRKSGVILGYANILVKNLVNLVYTPMLLSFVGQADYGVFQASSSFVFSLTLLTFGFSGAYVRFYTVRKENGDKAGIKQLNGMYLVLYSAVTALALVLGFALAGNARALFSSSFTGGQVILAQRLLQIMTLNIAVTLFSTVFDSYIIAHEQFVFQQTRQLLTSLATPLLAFGFLLMGFGAVGVALAQLGVTLLLLLLNAKFAFINLGMRFDVRHFDVGLFGSISAFSAWIFANQICDLVNQNVPNFLLGTMASASAVAVFAVAVQIRSVFSSLSTTMSSVFVPKVNSIVAKTDDNFELTRLMTKIGRYQLILFTWVFGGFILLGHFFIQKWAGKDFESAYWLICAMTFPFMVPLCQNIGIEIQRAKNRHKARSLVYLLMAVVNILITLLFARSLGYWAPAIGFIVSMLFGPGLFMNWYYQKRIGLDMRYFWSHCFPVVFYGLISVAIVSLFKIVLPVSSWATFLLVGLVYTVVYLLFIWSGVANNAERQAVITRLPFLR